jgi:hypothetical protein
VRTIPILADLTNLGYIPTKYIPLVILYALWGRYLSM